MSDYRIAVGWNQQDNLAAPPTLARREVLCDDVQPGRRQTGGDGIDVVDGGWLSSWRYPFLIVDELSTVYSAFGLSSAWAAKVTVYTRDETHGWGYYNAIIKRPANLKRIPVRAAQGTGSDRTRLEGTVFPLLLVQEVSAP